MSTDFWNDRYGSVELVYGLAPNDFLAEMSKHFPSAGDALDIGAGEGRNAMFLASLGFRTLAVDQSEVGMQKAMRLAGERGLPLQTQIADLRTFNAEPESFDVISSIFVHLPADIRRPLHAGVQRWLKPNGLYVLEVYAPDQIARTTGGPKDPAVFASLDEIVAELHGLKIEHRAALVRNVNEGDFHSGEASVLQVMARKA